MIAILLAFLAIQDTDWLSTVTVPEEPPAVKAEADWIGTVSPTAPAKDDACKCDCEKDIDALGVMAFAHEQEINDLKAAVEELRQKMLTTKSTEPVDLSGILREIAELKARPAFTESEIRAFAKEEIQKFHAEVKMPSGEVKKIEATDVKVTVNGYSGTFEVPPGGVVTSIDGKPVGSSNGWVRSVDPVTRRTTSMVGQTDNFNFRAVPQQNNVRFFALPRANSTCRIVNGVRVCN